MVLCLRVCACVCACPPLVLCQGRHDSVVFYFVVFIFVPLFMSGT